MINAINLGSALRLAKLSTQSAVADASLIGSLYYDASAQRIMMYENTTSKWQNLVADGSVTSAKIAANAVTDGAMDIASINGNRLRLASVEGTRIATSTITTSNLANACVGTLQIADASVTAAKMADGAVSISAIADDSISAAKLKAAALGVGLTKAALAPVISDLPSYTHFWTTSTNNTGPLKASYATAFTPGALISVAGSSIAVAKVRLKVTTTAGFAGTTLTVTFWNCAQGSTVGGVGGVSGPIVTLTAPISSSMTYSPLALTNVTQSGTLAANTKYLIKFSHDGADDTVSLTTVTGISNGNQCVAYPAGSFGNTSGAGAIPMEIYGTVIPYIINSLYANNVGIPSKTSTNANIDMIKISASDVLTFGTSTYQFTRTALTLLNNTSATAVPALSFAFATYCGSVITYSIKETSGIRIGKLFVVSNGTDVSITDQSAETSDVGVTWSIGINGSIAEVRYTTTNLTSDRTMQADVNLFSAI